MACVLCLESIPVASKRRRLYGISSSIALQSLKEASSEVRLENIIPKESCGDGSFLCLPCFRNLEKYSKVKTNLHQLETELRVKIRSTASAQKISPLPDSSVLIPG